MKEVWLMSRFNQVRPKTGPHSVITSTDEAINHSGQRGYARDTKSELFLLAVTHLGDDTFYESAKNRDTRFAKLCGEVAVADPDWFLKFVTWLRGDANMRTAPLVAAGHGVAARLKLEKFGTNRQIINAVLQRADEPGEMLAFWLATYGTKGTLGIKKLPMPVKRGIGDAAWRLYTEFSSLKYDTPSREYRFGDVLAFTHPDTKHSDLLQWLVARRYGRDEAAHRVNLDMVRTQHRLRVEAERNPSILLDTDLLQRAGMTWEDVLSLAGNKVDKKALWEALIPTMGYMALLRNLRNFDEAGVDERIALQVGWELMDPDQILRSRQLPLRFLSAYRAAPSLRWSYPLEVALNCSLANIPVLPGRTLVMIDTSQSMDYPLSAKSDLRRWDAATLFGLALASRCSEARVVSFAGVGHTKVFVPRRAESVLSMVNRWKSDGYFLRNGTATGLAIKEHYAGHDRVVVLTDEQDNTITGGGYGWGYRGPFVPVNESLPAKIPLFTWNLAGYATGHAPSGSMYRHTIGGLNDQGFRMIPMITNGMEGAWPWEVSSPIA
jgi:hypothetical protein